MFAFKSLSRCLLLVVLLATSAAAWAQDGPGPGHKGERLAQLENAKIAFITNRVTLTQEQAQKFWPLYNEFSAAAGS
jgi:hypothetical protein